MKKGLFLMWLFFWAVSGTAQTPVYTQSPDSLVHLTRLGAIRVLNMKTDLDFCEQISKTKSNIIHLQESQIIIKNVNIQSLGLESFRQQEIIKRQDKKIFWVKVENWVLRITLAGAFIGYMVRG